MQKVAVGAYDSSLQSYAAETRAFGRPVILSFAPEANGNWYQWGYAGVKADHLLGLVWFDQAQHGGQYHQDWRLEDDPAALATFRAAMEHAG